MMISLLRFLIYSFTLLFLACNSLDEKSKWENESLKLINIGNNLEYRHNALNNSVDSLWDDVSRKIESSLQKDFPSVDREIFLNSRNADHIRMFMSFQLLQKDIQTLINEAGKKDKMLADQIRSLANEMQEFENRKMKFLSKVYRYDEEASKSYTNKFRSLCFETSI